MSIGVGGDVLPGTSMLAAVQVLADDDATEAIALVGEIGGSAELDVADWIREYRDRATNPKSVASSQNESTRRTH